jgi:hypothetical protein
LKPETTTVSKLTFEEATRGEYHGAGTAKEATGEATALDTKGSLAEIDFTAKKGTMFKTETLEGLEVTPSKPKLASRIGDIYKKVRFGQPRPIQGPTDLLALTELGKVGERTPIKITPRFKTEWLEPIETTGTGKITTFEAAPEIPAVGKSALGEAFTKGEATRISIQGAKSKIPIELKDVSYLKVQPPEEETGIGIQLTTKENKPSTLLKDLSKQYAKSSKEALALESAKRQAPGIRAIVEKHIEADILLIPKKYVPVEKPSLGFAYTSHDVFAGMETKPEVIRELKLGVGSGSKFAGMIKSKESQIYAGESKRTQETRIRNLLSTESKAETKLDEKAREALDILTQQEVKPAEENKQEEKLKVTQFQQQRQKIASMQTPNLEMAQPEIEPPKVITPFGFYSEAEGPSVRFKRSLKFALPKKKNLSILPQADLLSINITEARLMGRKSTALTITPSRVALYEKKIKTEAGVLRWPTAELARGVKQKKRRGIRFI